jgi:hypothetical protein
VIELPHRKVADGIVIEVKVDPRSCRAEIAGVLGAVVKVRLTAPPVGGAANEQLIELLAKAFGVRKGDVVIVRGEASRRKVIRIMRPALFPVVTDI